MSEQVGPLPSGWTSLRLDEIAEVRLGRQRSPERAIGDHMCPYMRAGNVTWKGLVLDDVKEMDFTPTEQAIYRLVPGDILMSEASGSASEVGKPAVWNDQIPGACFQNTLLRVRPPRGLTRYLFWHLMADALSGRFIDQSPGVGIHHLGATRLSRWPIRLAPEGERQAIAEEIEKQLTRIDAGVAALTRVQANLKRYRASILKAACEGRLVPTEAELARRESREYEPASVLLQRIVNERRVHWETSELSKLKSKGKSPTDDRWKCRYKEPEALDPTELPQLPEGWCWATTDMVGDVLLGRQRAPQYLTGKWTRPYLRVANVKDDRVDLSDIETMDFDPVHFAQYRLLPGDILVSEGQSPELVGQSAIYRGGIDGLCFQKTLHRFRRMQHGPTPEFAQIVFRAHVKTGFFRKVASITTNIAHLTLEKFKAAPFPLPPLAEQVRITAEVKRRTSLADHLQEALSTNGARANSLRQSILASAFQGKLTGTPDRSDADARSLANASARQLRSSLPDEAFANA